MKTFQIGTDGEAVTIPEDRLKDLVRAGAEAVRQARKAGELPPDALQGIPAAMLVALAGYRDAMTGLQWRHLGGIVAGILAKTPPEGFTAFRRLVTGAQANAIASDARFASVIKRVTWSRGTSAYIWGPALRLLQEQEELRRREERIQAQEKLEREREKAATERAERERRMRALVARVESALASDYLGADEVAAGLVDKVTYTRLRRQCAEAWASRVLKEALDEEQLAAVAHGRGDLKIMARAGSGKTRTLVTRAVFLQTHCRVPPGELLLLAFNKKAAEEMRDRLKAAVGQPLPHVMTFHALAHALTHPEVELISDDSSTQQFGRSREVQEVIDEYVRSSRFGPRIRGLMLAHFREDWERIAGGRFDKSIDEFLAYRRALPRETLGGDLVKSYGEKVIANALFEHGVPYRYERNFRWGGTNYKPDFTIPPSQDRPGIVIEYFGMSGTPDYDAQSEAKRLFWATQPSWRFIELSRDDLASQNEPAFVVRLLQCLMELEIPLAQLSDEEIWQRIRERAIDRFTGTVTTFIARCRHGNLTPEDLSLSIGAHQAASRSEQLFLELAEAVYQSYLHRLEVAKKDDFDGLMWRAIESLRQGASRFVRDRGREQGDLARLQFVLVDEFQDFSPMFYEMCMAIRRINPSVSFCCVGDDWQAINGFAGADLRFFDNFEALFEQSPVQRTLRVNYRSSASIVAVGNAVMHDHGPPSIAHRKERGEVLLGDLADFVPSAAEEVHHKGDEITPAVLRLTSRFLRMGHDVTLLCRRHQIPWYVDYRPTRTRSVDNLSRFLEHIRAFLPEEDRRRVSASTVHGYKGMERSGVIVLDAVGRSYPLIHPGWIFLRIFGDDLASLEAEERRLFYVALTRATQALGIITERSQPSPFLEDIRQRSGTRVRAVAWRDLPAVRSLNDPRVEIRVFNAFEVRDRLKDLGYRWNGDGNYWYRSELADAFSVEELLGQSWTTTRGLSVLVRTEDGQTVHEHLNPPGRHDPDP